MKEAFIITAFIAIVAYLTTENIIVSLLIFNLGAIFTIGLMLATLASSHKNLSHSFYLLARDFKEHVRHKSR